MTQLSANVRGYVMELQAQVQMLSERAANLAASLAVANEQIELREGIIRGLRDELAAARANDSSSTADC